VNAISALVFRRIAMEKTESSSATATVERRGRGTAWLPEILVMVCALSVVPARAQERVVLVGSGSSVPLPLFNRWSQEYNKRNPRILMKYLPIGTSEGIKQISHGSGDFGAGEVPLSAKERSEAGLIELPIVLIAIVPIYNLPEAHERLRLSGEVLAEIFLGDVKTWSAPQIARLNPEVALPNLPIQVVNRPGGKGSNYVFTEFLSKASPKFREQVGVNPSPKWPLGVPAERSSDMADRVKAEPGAIGYVELQYAVKNRLLYAAVQNPAGKFVIASAQSIADACQSVEAPHWNSFATSLVDAPGAESFPITSFSWIYLRTKSGNHARAALGNFLEWIYTNGQQFAEQEGYSELPGPLLAEVKRKVETFQ
jgi:phosphate transport system substrate-binding protein